ncbi:MAG: CHASE3 domain-containing protein [Candidatus Obscuribacterales bacterium]|nr:CHASE3 domain-containing protein [Candidatus Obscuribacterales bacterium]
MSVTSKKTASFRNNLVFLGLVAVAMVVIAAFVAYQHALRLIELGQQVAHSHEILAELEATESQIRDVETAQRGYVVINEDFLGPYHEALTRVSGRIHRLANLTSDNPSQKDNVSRLLVELKNELAFAEGVVAARQQGQINLVLQKIEAGRGNSFTDRIRDCVKDMRVEEKHLLALRTGSLNDSSTQMIMTVALLGIISLALLMLLLVSANMYIAERARIEGMSSAQYDVARAIAEAHDINSAITRVLKSICENLLWDAGACWRYDLESGELGCAAFWHGGPARLTGLYPDPAIKAAADNDLLAKVWGNGEALWLSDLRQGETYPRSNLAVSDGMITGFVIPVFTEGKVSAVFELFSRRRREPDDRLLETLDTICSQLGQFIFRRQFEDRLEASQARLNAILSNMAEAVIVVDMSGQVTESNPAAERIFGAEILAGSVHDWTESCGIFDAMKRSAYPVKDLPIFKAIKGGSVDGEEMFIRNSAAPGGIYVSATGRPLRDDESDLIGGIMVLRDISERKLAEKRVSEFYSMVSHELRTPLTSIRASLGLMQGGVAGELSEMSRQLVDIGREECDRLIRLINDILDIRKIEAGKMELKLAEIQPAQLVQVALEGMKSVADEVGIELNQKQAAPGLVTCDEDRILQVLTNLISNAIKFSPSGREVSISTEWVDSEWLRFSVEDSGSGIPADHVPKLFQKFQQLDQSDTRSKGGTGLGLAICKAIVDEHHGRIGVKTVLGQGSTFFFELPREQPESNGKK